MEWAQERAAVERDGSNGSTYVASRSELETDTMTRALRYHDLCKAALRSIQQTSCSLSWCVHDYIGAL